MQETNRIVPRAVQVEYEVEDINQDGLPEQVLMTRCQWEQGVEYDESSPEYMQCFSHPHIILSGGADFSELQRITNHNSLDVTVGQRYSISNPYDESGTVFEGTVIGFLDFPSHLMAQHGAVTFISYTAEIRRDDGTITFADIDNMSIAAE